MLQRGSARRNARKATTTPSAWIGGGVTITPCSPCSMLQHGRWWTWIDLTELPTLSSGAARKRCTSAAVLLSSLRNRTASASHYRRAAARRAAGKGIHHHEREQGASYRSLGAGLRAEHYPNLERSGIARRAASVPGGAASGRDAPVFGARWRL